MNKDTEMGKHEVGVGPSRNIFRVVDPGNQTGKELGPNVIKGSLDVIYC